MSDPKPTIKTIAQLAGVSYVTVSRALRDAPDIALKTKTKILEIADEINYIPNAVARNLSSKSTRTIGLIMPDMGYGTIYGEMFNTISRIAAKENVYVLMGSCSRNDVLEKTFCRLMRENRIGVLIITPVSGDVSHIKEICKGIPIVFVGGNVADSDAYIVSPDYARSGVLAVEYLYSLGHRDIAFAVYTPDNLTKQKKLLGYNRVIDRLGLEPRVYRIERKDEIRDSGKALANIIISETASGNRMPSAVWCATDIMAVGLMEELAKHGVAVPEDISVVGHDGLLLGDLDAISLTTLSLRIEEFGTKVMDIALALLKEDPGCPKGQHLIPPSLIIRNSVCGPPK
jgi:DNA-binding LacI/PurR family transcriptional regulator